MRWSVLLSSLLAGLSLLGPGPLCAQIVRPVKQLEGVNVTEHLDSPLPLDLPFVDDRGRPVRLRQFFDGKRPVVLSLNYATCPMLCGLQLNGMVESLRDVQLEPGRDYEIVCVSIDPLETPMQARAAKQGYMRAFGRGTEQGWSFLTGKAADIRTLAEAVGFEYRYVAERREYAHAAVFMIATPDGRLSRYLYGVRFEPKTVQLSLVEAAEGRIGTTLDRILLFCFHYDAMAGSYAPTAVSLMKVGGAATVLGILVFLLPWRSGWRKLSGAGSGPLLTSQAQSASPVTEPPSLV